MKLSTFGFLGLVVLSLVSCVKKQTPVTETVSVSPERQAKTPEDVVRGFITASASAREDADRSKLTDLCMGEMRRTFERMTPEAFKISYLNNQITIKAVRILENSTEGETARVRYQVDVDNKGGTDNTSESNEREVELVKSQGAWFIDSIKPRGSDKIAFTRGMIF